MVETPTFEIDPDLIENNAVRIVELEDGSLSVENVTNESEVTITADGEFGVDASMKNAVYPTVEDIPTELEEEGAQVYTQDEGLVVFEAE